MGCAQQRVFCGVHWPWSLNLKAYHEKVRLATRPCCRLDIPSSTGKVPDTMKCLDCHRSMETFISYKCCHIDGPNAHH
ncbi:protein SIEVE ELEMENT OCCLUSION B-like [Prunus yedoensis var. nudiflora]|uniref:Protein SIEVE ELEMENT OCCLUSION B-like n=1 Tax=Prunus yedoensis var. nudiflora TaxID=2094558 RepID=A0A314Z825_PRUYE|nr:protein SIEVE ELEMENT OCCLUSION B-like [Prunus yedoensis var. nudiflora]